MQESENKRSPVADYLIKTVFDPVLWYTVIALSAIMYHYYDLYAFRFTVAAFAVSYTLFRLFDYINKHRLIGTVLYIAAGYLFFAATQEFISRGYQYYEKLMNNRSMSYGLWFITPQLALDYNVWYSCATFMLFSFFMCSVIYYFTRIRYRVFMSFLIFMIPFIIYGKEYELMEIPYVVLLLTGYIFLMVYCRQLRGDAETVVVRKKQLFASAGVFTVIFAIIASVVPKPQIKEDREAIETLIAAEKFTDRLVATLSAFRGTSSGGQFRRVSSNTRLYLAKSDEPLHFKVRTMTYYDYAYDTWSASQSDSRDSREITALPATLDIPSGKLAESILLAAKLDSDFAQTYGLTEFTGKEIKLPEERSVTLYSVFDSGKAVPVPQYARSVTDSSYTGDYLQMISGPLLTTGPSIRNNDDFTFTYSADTFFSDSTNKAFIDALSGSDYRRLLMEAEYILDAEMTEAYHEGEAERYSSAKSALKIIENERTVYQSAQEQLNYDDHERIRKLAASVTSGLPTEYEKARALEMYFFNNDYNYDLNYLKSQGENVESFIFNTKRGVCFEYATAMILMARSCGIPARYCEGYNMQTLFPNSKLGTNYTITAMDAHAYPELYIKGYGWTVFEPTISDGTLTEQREEGKESNGLARAGVILLIASLLALTAYIVSPFVIHKIFISRCRRKSPEKAAIAVMLRICRVYSISPENTSQEAEAYVKDYSGADISEAVVLFDAAAYGEAKLSPADREKLIGIYITSYEAYRETRKRSRRFRLKRS
ncbi:MAG: transglutaminase domain-containing protein [Ruminococcus sp.]|nr:transglutaminase domain-containing protein [Ruminococcus sp.]